MRPQHYEETALKVDLLDIAPTIPFCLGNMIKYLTRAGHKEGTDDLTKAKVYARIVNECFDECSSWAYNNRTTWRLCVKLAKLERLFTEEYNPSYNYSPAQIVALLI